MTPKLFISAWYFPHSPWGGKGGHRGPWEAHRPSVRLRPGQTGPHGPHTAISSRFTWVAHSCTCPASSGALRRPGSVAPSSWLQALRQAPHKEARQPPCPLPRQGPTPQARTTASVLSSRPGAVSPHESRSHPVSRLRSHVGGPGMVRGLGQGTQASPAPECDLSVCPGPWAPQAALMVKNPPVNSGDVRDSGSIPGSGRSPEKGMATHSGILPGTSHGQRSLAGFSLRVRRARHDLAHSCTQS